AALRGCALFPYTTLFRSTPGDEGVEDAGGHSGRRAAADHPSEKKCREAGEGEAEQQSGVVRGERVDAGGAQREQQQRHAVEILRSEEHTSELQSRSDLVC